jgi:hypothetical protein
MEVGRDRKSGFAFHPCEDGDSFLEAGAAKRARRGPVRLVERGLVDERDAASRRDALQRLRHAERVRLAFDHVRSGDQDERRARAYDDTVSDADSR